MGPEIPVLLGGRDPRREEHQRDRQGAEHDVKVAHRAMRHVDTRESQLLMPSGSVALRPNREDSIMVTTRRAIALTALLSLASVPGCGGSYESAWDEPDQTNQVESTSGASTIDGELADGLTSAGRGTTKMRGSSTTS